VIIVLNGPLGIGKSTLAEALMESIDSCAMVSGDHLLAVNPAPKNELEQLHSAIELLIEHHRRSGYQRFVI
jgi:adenylate kinase family enzyme